MFAPRIVVCVIIALVSFPAAVFAAEPTPATELGYGALLVKLALILAGVCLLAWVSLRWGLQKFVAAGDRGDAMTVVARTTLEPRRSLLVVRVGSRHLLLASSEAGVEKIAELDDADASLVSRPKDRTTFSDALRRVAVSRETPTVEEAA